MKTVLIIFLFLLTISAHKSYAMEIIIYNKGATDKVQVTSAQEKLIQDIIKDIYEKADKTINFNVSRQDITGIKSKSRCVEIIFDMSYSYSNSAIGSSVIRRILVPLSGNYAGDFKNGALNFFAGLDDYNGKEYSNSTGFKYIEQMYKVLQR